MRSPNKLVIPAKAIPLETSVKQTKAKAHRSPLWTHLDEIHRWRMAQETWEAIADKLSLQYGINVSIQGVQVFFKRAIDRDRRRPLGFMPERPSSIVTQTVPGAAQDPDSIYEEARQAVRQEQQSKPKIIKPDRPL
jgi:hypothetical protein